MDDIIVVPPGMICTAEQYNRTLNNDATIHCLSRGESIGLTIIAETGLLSLLSVVFVFIIIFRNVVMHIRHAPAGKFSMVQEPMDILMLSLFIGDFIQALGAVMDIKWINEGTVQIGNFCAAQGVIQQLGETGVAMTTLLIAIYTFIGVWWRIGMGVSSVRVAKVMVCLVWLFVLLMIVIGNATHSDKHELFESPTPYWCWLGQNYLQFRIWGEYFWFWITLAFSVFAYTLLFLWSRGNITLDEYSWWKFSIHRSSKFDVNNRNRLQSLIMLAYPIVYSILILPLSVVRWIGFVQERGGGTNTISASATMAVTSIYGLSGALNVVLLLTTRPNSILFGRSTCAPSRKPTVPLATYKTNSVNDTDGGDPSSDLGRLPSRSSAGWG
ncbi:hypothetical protein Hypma_002509 [Hypsizygus marmoreus]|uniref:G-protein coupled receptors family 1 profile domain-containing protein n=1 Tax=Hypsizygus marmoreus TaxID=39966 RepID=A0A369J640_HYPMA|nr:hypothetical protein Hypma_002509 [Hypsizygus marmoreus]